ncbi:MAG: HAD family acid phosphatase [Pseudomonadota bacterium]
MKQKAIICDLDGTLANIDHRLHYLRQTPPNWPSFMSEVKDDQMNLWCQEILLAFTQKDYKIVLISGRGEESREGTEEWLKRHQVPYEILLLRAAKDYRPDDIIKQELYAGHVRDRYDVLFVLEDRLSVVRAWREMGLVCLQCDWGNF